MSESGAYIVAHATGRGKNENIHVTVLEGEVGTACHANGKGRSPSPRC
jgi:hypothetical protein